MLTLCGPQALLTAQYDLAGGLLPVDFHLHAPEAGEVYLIGEMTDWLRAKLPMQRGADGVWRLRLKLRRGQWVYKFEVDGRWIDDPDNPLRAEDGMGVGGWHSYRFVGDGDWNVDPVLPAGMLLDWSVHSRRLGREVPVSVYLPHERYGGGPYPLLLLLHGHQVSVNQWPGNGRLQAYMDNLLAQRLILPFAVAMPHGHAEVDMMRYGHFIHEELLPGLGEAFPLAGSAARRAAGGMSIRRFGPLALALDHPHDFGLVAPVNENLADHVQQAAAGIGDYPFRLQLYCTSSGCAYPRYEEFVRVARRHGAALSYMRIAGEPTWRHWNGMTRELLMGVSDFFAEQS